MRSRPVLRGRKRTGVHGGPMVVVVSVCASAAGGLLAVGAGVVPLALARCLALTPQLTRSVDSRVPFGTTYIQITNNW